MKRRWFRNTLWVCAVCTGPALAEGPPPFPEFTFKRIGLPSSGSNRITVQIDPAEQAAALAGPSTDADSAVPDAAMVASGYEWFWEEVSFDVAQSGPANLNLALEVLTQRQDKQVPRLQSLQDIAAAHGLDILKATIGTKVSPALVLAVIAVESGGRADAVSSAGAEGVMQLIPATAERFGVTDASIPAENIKGGVAYLSWLLDQFDQDPILALAGYNAGENAVRENAGVPPFAETRAYVPKVLSAWQVARGLCMTPPELISDGCVFAVKGS
ncbi:MAG TPA: lytic transglycosylase domain-containing protein [Aliiroseovarius sp.]|nr:lytic transglycosylase domain-containing protein [Aliiroseovarius sp.]